MQARANQAVLLQASVEPVFARKWLRWIMLGMLLGSMLYWLNSVLKDPLTLPIEKIRVQSTFNHVDEAMLQDAVAGIKGTGYFNINVAQVQQLIEQLAWVKQASVRRVWPATLAIRIEEQQPLALWAAGGIVNKQAELFKAGVKTYPQGLPIFKGPQGSYSTVAMHYRDVNEMLAPVNLQALAIEMDARQALTVKLNNGLELKLGRQDVLVRLQRFARVYPLLQADKPKQPASVDLRYTNGMAITWK